MDSEPLTEVPNLSAGKSTEEIDQPTDNTPNAFESLHLGFRMGDLGFLISTQVFSEIITTPQVNPLPKVPEWFLGLQNLRGNVIPVLDWLLYLEQPPSQQNKRQLVALDKGDKTVAIWVDGYPEIISNLLIKPATIPLLPSKLQAYTQEAFEYKQQIWLNLKLGDFLKNLGQQLR